MLFCPRSASSSSVRRIASGVRSSCEASATNVRSRSNAACSRASISLSVRAEPGQLVVAHGLGHAPALFAGADRRGAGAHPLDGPQRRRGDEVAREAREREPQRPGDQQQRRERVQRVVALLERLADHDHDAAGAGALGRREEPQVRAARQAPALGQALAAQCLGELRRVSAAERFPRAGS